MLCQDAAKRRTLRRGAWPRPEEYLLDHDRFDTLVRAVFANRKASRRAAGIALLGAVVMETAPSAAVAKRQSRRRNRATTSAVDRCYPNTNCVPGPGRNASRCDFAFSTVFRNLNVRGANLGNSSFTGADLTGADFRGANLSGACFVSADLTGVRLGSAVNLHKAVFCNTVMPDGTRNDSDCAGTTPCCHLRSQNCPDESFTCWTLESSGNCRAAAGTLRVGTCWSFPTCCPCEHNDDHAYWNEQCQLNFPEGCAGRCQAEFEGANACHEGFICP